MVMEYIDGITLAAGLEGGGCPSIGLSLEIARQSLDAIGYVHRGGVVHRDIAPDNIMLARGDFGEPLVKLIDLGIAKLLKGESGLTATGMFLGKIAYASPEQFLADRDIDSRADLYSFGVVLHELLTDEHPMGSKKPSTVMGHHVRNLPVEFRDPAGRVPEDLRAVVVRALAREPDERCASAEELSKDLNRFEERFPLTLEDFQIWIGSKSRAEDAPSGDVEGAGDGGAPVDPLDESTKPGGIPDAVRDAQAAREAELVSFMVSASQFDLARERLDATVSRLGDCERLGVARRAIEAAEQRWREREAEVESRLEQARERLTSDDLDGANDLLRNALGDYPDHPRIAELLEEVEGQLQRRREEEERRRRVQTIAREAERLLAFGARDRKGKKSGPRKKG